MVYAAKKLLLHYALQMWYVLCTSYKSWLKIVILTRLILVILLYRAAARAKQFRDPIERKDLTKRSFRKEA